MDPRNLLRVIEAAAKAAGIEDVGIHTLRQSPCPLDRAEKRTQITEKRTPVAAD